MRRLAMVAALGVVGVTAAGVSPVGAIGGNEQTASPRQPTPPLDVSVKATKNGPDINGGEVTVKKEGKGKTYLVRVKNTMPDKQKALLDDTSGGPGNLKVRWRHDGENVTADAVGDGYKFKLGAQEHTTFELTITPKVDDPGALCASGSFEPQPTGGVTYGYLYVNSDGVCS